MERIQVTLNDYDQNDQTFTNMTLATDYSKLPPVTLQQIAQTTPRKAERESQVLPSIHPNPESGQNASFEDALEYGYQFLTGSNVLFKTYLTTYRSPLTPWMKLAFVWACQNPALMLRLEIGRRTYEIFYRGGFVEIAIAGDRHWITKDGRSRYLTVMEQ